MVVSKCCLEYIEVIGEYYHCSKCGKSTTPRLPLKVDQSIESRYTIEITKEKKEF